VPCGEPTWLTPACKSPYYKESHGRLQRAVRVWVDEVLKPEAQEKELSGECISGQGVDAMGRNNLLAVRLGPGCI
jgi:hypothetical protein